MDAIDKINVVLARKGISGAELERLIGVSNSVYSQWNTKQTKPSKKSLAKVADALGVDVAEILPDEMPKLKEKKPAPVGDELDAELIEKLTKLKPEEAAMVRAYIDGMIANRK